MIYLEICQLVCTCRLKYEHCGTTGSFIWFFDFILSASRLCDDFEPWFWQHYEIDLLDALTCDLAVTVLACDLLPMNHLQRSGESQRRVTSSSLRREPVITLSSAAMVNRRIFFGMTGAWLWWFLIFQKALSIGAGATICFLAGAGAGWGVWHISFLWMIARCQRNLFRLLETGTAVLTGCNLSWTGLLDSIFFSFSLFVSRWHRLFWCRSWQLWKRGFCLPC